jgi:catechol 2,3-dioxygenase-like lactoylglutathione lyase family enzyme
MLTYVYFGTNDLERATRFYDATLAPLGMQRCITGDPARDRLSSGWGLYEEDGARELAFWVTLRSKAGEHRQRLHGGLPSTLLEVEQFHTAALAHGGTSDGAPGLRAHYNTDFYAAYVRDPDGNKTAAVCRGFSKPQ